MLCLFTGLVSRGADDPANPASAAARPYPHAPAWVADQTLYEVNLRQFSPQGNVEGFVAQLPRLKELGVGTIWFMPVNPIGQLGHAGTLGSPYAVADYSRFNPEFGTIEQFKSAVDQAHRLGMFVIMDWVAPHTALDNVWIQQHPDWYKHDADGHLVPPLPSWKDVAGLDYNSTAMRQEMISQMSNWVRNTGIDGFRCDSAEFVPLDFWCDARDALRKIKPVFMLAEGNNPELVSYAFDAAYAWNLPPNTEGIVKGAKTVPDLVNFFKAEARLLSGDGFRLNYTTNHDKNAWEGTTQQLLGAGEDAFTVLTFTAPGMPLIYNGQEAGDPRRLNLFEHDPIAWRDDPAADLFRTLARLKRDNFALWDGLGSAPLQFITGQSSGPVLTFQRQFQGDRVVVMLNLGPAPATATLPTQASGLHQVLGGDAAADPAAPLTLNPWGYRVWANQP